MAVEDGKEFYSDSSFGGPVIQPKILDAFIKTPESSRGERREAISRRDRNLDRELFLAAIKFAGSHNPDAYDYLVKKSAFYEGALHMYEIIRLQNETETLNSIPTLRE